MNFQKEFDTLSKKLDEAIKENNRDIQDSLQELKIIKDVMQRYPDKFTDDSGLKVIVQDALDDAKANVADGEKLIKAYGLLHGRKERVL